jgi:hypothetical protein
MTSVPATVEELGALGREEGVELFLRLPPPVPEEFLGEFDGFTPAYLARQFAASATDDGLGRWLGKAFAAQPFGRWSGQGYNIWETDGGVTRHVRFGWRFGTSLLDGGPCVVMEYAAFDNGYGKLDLTDEIRRLDDGLYVAVATTREPSVLCPDAGGPAGRALPTTFVLRGPVRPWVGPDDPRGEVP